MKFDPINPPRVFTVGFDQKVDMKDCGRVRLDPDEQVTFLTESGAEYDVARKSWGFYATPSTNGRLKRFGFRSVLVRNRNNLYFVFLVEEDKVALFEEYAAGEPLAIVLWLDDLQDLDRLERQVDSSDRRIDIGHCDFCQGRSYETIFTYREPPAQEVRFPMPEGSEYFRRVFRCLGCGHFVSLHEMESENFYEEAYVESTYGKTGLRAAFDRITALPPQESDNVGRVKRVLEFASKHIDQAPDPADPPSVLDIGTGLCVFLHRMKEAGWKCLAVDPDPRAAEHARTVVGVEAVTGDFMTLEDLGKHDVVTFNKVLEHVHDPTAMLARSAEYLKPGGFVYVELPDGEAAHVAGPDREEFYIEHHHVFSMASLALLATRAGFVIQELERLRDPSGKYTLRAFMKAVEA